MALYNDFPDLAHLVLNSQFELDKEKRGEVIEALAAVFSSRGLDQRTEPNALGVIVDDLIDIVQTTPED